MPADSVSLTISVPSALADSRTADLARRLLILDAVRSDRMTWRAAARALDIAPDRLLDMAREHGVPVARYEPADLTEDLDTLNKILCHHR
jgi:transcriptional regulator with GAF, ATPase, and Fis domain